MTLTRSVLACLCVLVLSPLPALAELAPARFDKDKTVSLPGVVKTFAMAAPHGSVLLVVTGADGKAVEWSLETAGPTQLQRSGWQAASLKSGDKITASIHPARDGGSGGELVSVTLADGQVLPAGQQVGVGR